MKEKQVVNELKGFLKKRYDFSKYSEYIRAFNDLEAMFHRGSKSHISGCFDKLVEKYS